jgi:hypothetical protein
VEVEAALIMTSSAENAGIGNGVLKPGSEMISLRFANEVLATRIRDIGEGRSPEIK